MKFRRSALLRVLLLGILAAAACKDGGQRELEQRQKFLTSREAVENKIRPGTPIDGVIKLAGPPAAVLEGPSGETHYHFIAPLPIPPGRRDCGGVDVQVKDGKVESILVLDVR